MCKREQTRMEMSCDNCLIMDAATKVLHALLSKRPTDVTDQELECAMRLALPGCVAKVTGPSLRLRFPLKRKLNHSSQISP